MAGPRMARAVTVLVALAVMAGAALVWLPAGATDRLTGLAHLGSRTQDGVSIDRGVFAYDEAAGTSHEMFVVTDYSIATPVVVAAVAAAAQRFMMVDETGHEHTTEAQVEAAMAHDLYTPNYTSDPEVTPDGVQLYVDCKGSIEEPMAETFRTILREELVRADVRARVRVAG
ncbi:hypothetical protein ABEG17_19560 [Pedococcus sp. KACC 23699]|uniref:Uncharacterized protein n=1 Tax=Pedococcus sp. KACC 23699 TaxID=3149228 RepID=A0AAU7JTI5_9MICO